MREDDGRKLDHKTLEALRLRAVEQVARGVPATARRIPALLRPDADLREHKILGLSAAARPASSEEDTMGVPVPQDVAADVGQAAVSPSTVAGGRPATDAAVPVGQWTPVVASTLDSAAAP